MEIPRQPPSPPGDAASVELFPVLTTERLSPRLAGMLGGTVLVLGPATLDLLHAVAGSASHVVLLGTDPAVLRLQRRALAREHVEEVSAVIAHAEALPVGHGGAGSALLVSPGQRPGAASRRELERALGEGPSLAILRAGAAAPEEGESACSGPAGANGERPAARDDVLAAAAGLALCRLGGTLPPRFPLSRPFRGGARSRRAAPAVTVVIPTRNRAPLLARAVESVLAQEVAPAEILIVDDGSTDATRAVIARHEGRVRALRREPAGQAAAMNDGVAAAGGDWIAWLDDDDYFLPAKLQLQLRTIGAPRIGLAVTAHYLGDAEGEPRAARPVPVFDPDGVLRLLLRGSIFLGPTAMVRRAAYAELGERPYDERLKRAADYALWWRIARRWQVAVLQVPLTVVCRHPGNALDLARARSIYESVRETLRWAWANVPLAELAGGAPLDVVRLERARALARSGLWAEARADLEAAVDTEPEVAGNLLGLAALESGDLPGAEERFAVVLRRAPRSRDALNGLATALLLRGRRPAASRAIGRALAAHPRDPLTRYNAALIAEPTPTDPGPALALARDLLAERGTQGALFSAAPPLRGIDAFFAVLRREAGGRDPSTPPPPASGDRSLPSRRR